MKVEVVAILRHAQAQRLIKRMDNLYGPVPEQSGVRTWRIRGASLKLMSEARSSWQSVYQSERDDLVYEPLRRLLASISARHVESAAAAKGSVVYEYLCEHHVQHIRTSGHTG